MDQKTTMNTISPKTAQRLTQALEDLPTKVLITSQFRDTNKCFCSIGAMMWREDCLNYGILRQTLSSVEATKIINENDNFEGSIGERWTHMHEWAISLGAAK